jgi:hypothetical protein
MAPSRKTWIWIIVALAGGCVLVLFGLAGGGLYFVSHHIQAARSTSSDALQAFDDARGRFKGQPPLFEVDSFDQPRVARSITNLPTSPIKPQNLWVLAWNPDDDRLVRVSLPFWLLRIGKQKIDLFHGGNGFDFQRLNLDVNELERIGPALVIDYRTERGERVLIWTQ